MANTKIKFYDQNIKSERSIEVYQNESNQLFIRINDQEFDYEFRFVTLDLATAIKFSKEVRREIAKIKEVEDGRR